MTSLDALNEDFRDFLRELSAEGVEADTESLESQPGGGGLQ